MTTPQELIEKWKRRIDSEGFLVPEFLADLRSLQLPTDEKEECEHKWEILCDGVKQCSKCCQIYGDLRPIIEKIRSAQLPSELATEDIVEKIINDLGGYYNTEFQERTIRKILQKHLPAKSEKVVDKEEVMNAISCLLKGAITPYEMYIYIKSIIK